MTMTTWSLCLVSALALGAGGCADRQRLTRSHGRAYHQAFVSQAANPKGPVAPAKVKGLDSQEAAIIARSYRRGLAPKGTQVEDESLLMIAPAQRQEQNYLPPPSVPQDKR